MKVCVSGNIDRYETLGPMLSSLELITGLVITSDGRQIKIEDSNK